MKYRLDVSDAIVTVRPFVEASWWWEVSHLDGSGESEDADWSPTERGAKINARQTYNYRFNGYGKKAKWLKESEVPDEI